MGCYNFVVGVGVGVQPLFVAAVAGELAVAPFRAVIAGLVEKVQKACKM